MKRFIQILKHLLRRPCFAAVLILPLLSGCAPLPGGTPAPNPTPAPSGGEEYQAGHKAGAELVKGYADAIDQAGNQIDAGEKDADKIWKGMQTGTAAVRKRAIEPLEDQLDKASPPDQPLVSKPFHESARGMREALK